ncbi:UBX domain-containing protein 1 [Condylostylus longicornis]|uniref:UBX domain-containing protein 1 n=1 Tax=Condylostylus longicornis TaxID=2530218 RepID=UPI00244DEEBA|nr:UBX domain-containing protein 1 [Condylostylus longicornis]
MSNIQTLVDMGFPKEKAEKALQMNGDSIESAMEWLLAHADEDISQSTTQTESTSVTNTEQEETQEGQPEEGDAQQAKSLKCDECNKLFRDQNEVEFHAAKTGHNNFSQSTEEKKPLTEEEKKAQLALIEEKLKQKRAEREKQERIDEVERERNRIKSGKDMTEAKKRLEELEMQKIVEQRKREKAEEKAARERVRAQIEADKLARKAKMAAEQNQPPPEVPPLQPTMSTQTQKKEYSNTRIQIRLQDGGTLTETFGVKEQLSAIRTFIQVKQGDMLPFDLMTSFPRKVFTDDDYEKPLEVLGLVPSAVIIVTKAK